MEERSQSVMLKAYAWVTLAAILIAVTCFSLVQGFLVHVKGEIVIAMVFYVVAWVCLGVGLLSFLKGKKLLQYFALST